MNKKLLFSIILSITFGFFSNSQSLYEKKNKANLAAEIDGIIQKQVDQDKIPGAVIQIKIGKNIVYKHAYGYAQKYNFEHQQINPLEKMTEEHLFDVASLTKVIGTTTSIMLLQDRGLLNIEDPVRKYIKAFDTPEKKEITIHQLLTHTAGLYEWYPLYYKASNKQESYKLIGELPLMFPVGEQRRYSDLGFVLLGEIIETVSKLPLEQFMQQNVFIPLEMKNTTFNPLLTGRFKKIAATSQGNPYERRMVSDSALGFKVKEIDPAQWKGWRTYTLKGEANDGNTWYANKGVSGAAGIFSTIDDIQKLVDMLVNKGKVGSTQFISKEIIENFLTKDKFNNGIGWMMDPENPVIKNGPEGTFGHTGFTGTSIAAIPENNISVIILINRQNIGLMKNGEYFNLSPLRQQVFEAVLKYNESK
jgi:CubicO group peptidase (beta-lactamase class C family)